MDISESQVRLRIRDPALFIQSSFRVHDIGRKGFTQRVGGRLRSNGKWATQSWRFSRTEVHAANSQLLVVNNPRTAKMIREIVGNHRLKIRVLVVDRGD